MKGQKTKLRLRTINFFKKHKIILLILGLFLVATLTTSSYLVYTNNAKSTGPKETLKVETPSSPAENPPEPNAESKPPEDQKKSANPATQAQGVPPASGANSSSSTPTPAPPAPDVLSATVAFYADSQSDTDGEDANHALVVNRILASGANPVFHAGDLLEDGTPESLARFNNVTANLRASRLFYSAQGNNERNSSVYFNNFNYPGNEHWYSVNYGNLHMIVLDNYASSVAAGSEQYNWLLSDLSSAASQSRITGVIFHYPVYGVGGDTKGMLAAMVPLFRTYGVDFVISGHEHGYRKSFVDGIYYFVTTGQPALGHMIMNVYTNRAVLTSYSNTGAPIETVTINKR